MIIKHLIMNQVQHKFHFRKKTIYLAIKVEKQLPECFLNFKMRSLHNFAFNLHLY